MAYSITIPFQAVKLRFFSGEALWYPLADPEALRLDANLHDLANQYAASFQKHALDEGRFISFLEERKPGPYSQKRFSVTFSASVDKIAHPEYSLDFDYFYRELDNGKSWGMVAALGLEAVAETEEALEKSLEEMVRLDYASNNRKAALQMVVSLIWHESAELLSASVKALFPGPAELEHNNLTSKQESWLHKAAYMPSISKIAAYGREEELKKLIRALKSPYMKNVLLTGPGGVGKTALVHELIRQKSKAGIGHEIWETTASLLIKELSTDMGWQENLSQLCKELKSRNAFLYVRNLFELFEVGKYEGNAVSMAEYLTPLLARGEITLISECSAEEKALIELRSPSFLSNFQVLQIEEPTEQLEEIILKKVNDIAQDQKVSLNAEAVRELIRLNRRYTPYSGFPGKPIRFLESLLLYKKASEKRGKTVLDKSEIIRYFCRETGIPPFIADPAVPVDFEAVRARFASQVFGQDRAVDSLANVLSAVKRALNRTGKPIASFLFVGPTGVGKTELVKVLAEFMFGSRERLTRFDMSEFSTGYAVQNLIGVDQRAGGLLTNAVRREPFSVILFDEIEKAHPNFFDYLLQVLGEGRLTDQSGKVANFCSSIIILTSNIGAANLQTNRISLKKEQDSSYVEEHFMSAVKKFFRPELFNRIDQVIPFAPLSFETMRSVIDRELNLLRRREGIAGRKLSLQIAPEAVDYLTEKGFNPLYGARYLQRVLQSELAIPLANILNQWDPMDHAVVQVGKAENGLRFDTESDPLSMELLLEELEKFNLANLCSDKRNAVHRLGEGSSFLNLVNEWAILEREKINNPYKFSTNPYNSKQYDRFSKIRTAFADIQKQIAALETELSLACMGFGPFNPALAQHLEEWDENWKQFRTNLFLQLNSGDRCWMSIYGTNLAPIIRLYRHIIKHKNFSVKGGEIWLNPTPPNPSLNNPTIYRPTPSGKEHFELIPKNDLDSFLASEKPPFANGALYGVHWYIEGPGAFWYFLGEEGFQKWLHPHAQPDFYELSLWTAQPALPDSIHRKDHYSRKPIRRTIAPSTFSDSILKIKEEPHTPDLLDFFAGVLEKLFLQRVDKNLK